MVTAPPETHIGWPPGIILRWGGYRWWMVPDPDHPPSYAVLGPPGSVWIFDEHAAIEHAGAAGVITRIMMFALEARLIDGTGTYVVPESLGLMDYYRATVRATLGSDEIMQHTMSFVKRDDSPVSQDPTEMTSVANFLRDQWKTWFTTAVGTVTPNGLIVSGVTYHDVQLQVLRITTAGGSVTQQGPTVLSGAFTTTGGSGPTPALPYEVACALTFRTRAAQAGGVSHGRRNRGRLYLGGFSSNALAADGTGLWDATKIHALATGFGNNFVAPIKADTTHGLELAIVSRAGLISHEVNSVQVGVVPDAQRRRRDAQTEAYFTGWSIA